MNSCSNGGKPLEEGALFCTFCGARQNPPPSPPESVCPNCGAKLEPDSRFCGSCGACLQAEEGAGQALPVPVPAAPLPAAADGEESALILRPYSRDGQKSGCGLRGSFCLSCWCCFWQRQALRGIAILPSGI